jgi:hypothetical protein
MYTDRIDVLRKKINRQKVALTFGNESKLILTDNQMIFLNKNGDQEPFDNCELTKESYFPQVINNERSTGWIDIPGKERFVKNIKIGP